MKLQYEFSLEVLFIQFRPLAAPSKCHPHPLATPMMSLHPCMASRLKGQTSKFREGAAAASWQTQYWVSSSSIKSKHCSFDVFVSVKLCNKARAILVAIGVPMILQWRESRHRGGSRIFLTGPSHKSGRRKCPHGVQGQSPSRGMEDIVPRS